MKTETITVCEPIHCNFGGEHRNARVGDFVTLVSNPAVVGTGSSLIFQARVISSQESRGRFCIRKRYHYVFEHDEAHKPALACKHSANTIIDITCPVSEVSDCDLLEVDCDQVDGDDFVIICVNGEKRKISIANLACAISRHSNCYDTLDELA